MSNYIRLYRAVKGIYRFTEQRFRGDVVRGFLQISTSSFAGRIKEEFHSGENARGRANELYLDFMDDLQKFCNQERSVEFYAGRRGMASGSKSLFCSFHVNALDLNELCRYKK